jgi:hypothetical protein
VHSWPMRSKPLTVAEPIKPPLPVTRTLIDDPIGVRSP